MRRVPRLVTISLAVVLGLAGSVSAHGGRHRITKHAGSHEHPPMKNFSLLCTRFNAPGDHLIIARATGPSVDETPVRTRTAGKPDERRRIHVTWDIQAPGDYVITAKVKYRKKTVSRSQITYTVPQGDPAVGPFPCD